MEFVFLCPWKRLLFLSVKELLEEWMMGSFLSFLHFHVQALISTGQ